MVAPISVNAGQVERDNRRAGSLADRDRQLAVLHRGVEGLLERAREPVDLVDEEDAARIERREVARHVALALERRAGGRHELRLELVGHDLGERGLAEAGRAGEQHVVERLAARPGRLDEDRELLLHALLADEVGEALRAQRAVEIVLRRQRRRVVISARHRGADPGLIAPRPQRVGDQVLGALTLGPVEQPPPPPAA